MVLKTGLRDAVMLCVLAVGLLLPAACAAADTTGQISQFGVTWTFAQPVTYGQFANGDYWVVGPVQITSIDPPSADIGGRTKNGSMINPGLGMTQGYDSAMYGVYGPAYSAALNVALGVSPGSPLTVQSGSSLISSISIDTAGNRPQLRTAAVLTVLATPATAGSFRPPYFGNDKTIGYNVSQLNYSKLPKLTPVANTPNLATVAGRFQRPWLEHVLSWTGRYCHPSDNMPDYGRDIALAIGDGALLLLLDYSDQEKQTLLVRLVQYGIDLYAIASAGGVWEDLGGHMHGRKLPILLAGLVLDDANMLAIGTTLPSNFQGDRQTWYVTQYDVGRPLYTADGRPREEYIQADVGIPEWGEQHTRAPQRDGRNWNAYYRRIVGHSILAHVLTARILGLKDAWNWDALFDYIDRYWEIEKDVNSSGGGNIPTFHKNMWLAHRGAMPPTGFQIAGWAVVANHGPAGDMTVAMSEGYVEPRLAGLRQLTIAFGAAVDPTTVLPGAVTIVGQTGGDMSSLISMSLDGPATTLTLSLASSLPDADVYTITVTDVLKDAEGNSVAGDVNIRISALAGDADGSGQVTNSDILAIRSVVGAALTPESARYDIDGSGAITGADMVTVRTCLGHLLP